MRLAVWSGPRNLSTAMMYAFAQRPDFAVWDEPFYAAYLLHSGVGHPLRDDIMASHESDPQLVAAMCTGSVPAGKPHFYMKHMALHMLPGFPLDWAEACTNIHLLRHPARVVASYGAKRADVTEDDIGFRQQGEIFHRLGGIVVDSADMRADPEGTLQRLCRAAGIGFDPAMLSWPVGGNAADGSWAAHWYAAVHDSSGFAGPEGPLPEVTGRDAALVEAALPVYEQLLALKI